jgi:lipopolysaccharide/colanic/teichoic acid biosynthesis glycosyltransferase
MKNQPLTIRELIKDLFLEWNSYLRSRLSLRRHSRRLGNFIQRRAVVRPLFIFTGITGIFWIVINKVYGQEAAVYPASAYISAIGKIMSFLVGSSAVAVAARFIQKRFPLFKRLFDFALSAIGLALLSPLYLILGLLVKLDSSGPVFFKQERMGMNGKVFSIWKFRTMRRDAESETGAVWASEGDPRVTRIGRFLRKSHLDETAQLVNVFRGEMSLIGPRPERPEMIEKINQHIPDFCDRLKIRPGITGMAQARYPYGASIKDAARKLKYDLLYIKRMCWMLELRIFLWTARRVLTGEGAR